MNAVARERARPIQAVFHSQSLRRIISDLGVEGLVGRGTSREIKAVIMPGPRTVTATRAGTLTVSGL